MEDAAFGKNGCGSSGVCVKNKYETMPFSQNRHKEKKNLATFSPQLALSSIMTNLQYEYSDFKYTVYRCAAKMVTLQKILYTARIPYKLVLAVLGRHSIRDADLNLMVPPFQLTSLIHDIYFACEKLGHFTKLSSYKLDNATSLLANFFWNVYDPNRRHSISLLEIKVTFLLISKLQNSENLIMEFYSLVADAKSKCVTKLNFENLLNTLTKLLSYAGEANAYGAHNIPLVMEQCFSRCHNAMGLTEYQFHYLWTSTQTRFLIYANLIALIKRIEDTEKLIHNNICASCHSDKIIGIRFKCQTCKSLSLCMRCFATGYGTNKHEVGHRMYEVFTEDLPPKKLSHYFTKLCNLFHCIKQTEEETRGFCNANETHNDTELVTIISNNSSTTTATPNGSSSMHLKSANSLPQQKPARQTENELSNCDPSLAGLCTATTNASNTSERLQMIIDKLLNQNQKLEQQLKQVQSATQEEIFEFLNSHQKFLVEIINEMRNFKVNGSNDSYPASSTPNRSVIAKQMPIHDGYNTSGSNLTHSINGADINRAYLDANKSDYSIQDISVWFNQRRMSMPIHKNKPLDAVNENVSDSLEIVEVRDTGMSNFRRLLKKVKEIVEDSYSDNTDLAEITQNLENVLDSIIKDEETRRKSS